MASGEELHIGDTVQTDDIRWTVYFGENQERPGVFSISVRSTNTSVKCFYPLDASILKGKIVRRVRRQYVAYY